MKRREENSQMSREEYESHQDNEDESNDPGRFTRADASVMAQRKIIRTKRPSSVSADTSSIPTEASASNPFGGLAFTKPAEIKNPFANISFGQGFAAPTQTYNLPVPPPVANLTKKSETKGEESKRKLRKLNRSFLSWLERQMQSNPLSIWKKGVVDYIKFASELSKTLPEPSTGISDFSFMPTTKPVELQQTVPTFSQPAPKAQDTTSKTSTTVSASAPFLGFKANAGSDVPQTQSTASSFQMPITAASQAGTGAFGFGKPAASAAQFSFPSLPAFSSHAPQGSFPSFSMSGSSSFPAFQAAPSSQVVADDEEGEGEEEPILEPEKISKNPDDRDEVLHEVPCKLFRFDKDSKEWKDVGKGSLKVTRDPDTKATRILIRNTMGKISLNASFYKGMSFQKSGNSAIRFAAVMGEDASLQSLMIKVKPTDVDGTLQVLSTQVSLLA